MKQIASGKRLNELDGGGNMKLICMYIIHVGFLQPGQLLFHLLFPSLKVISVLKRKLMFLPEINDIFKGSVQHGNARKVSLSEKVKECSL